MTINMEQTGYNVVKSWWGEQSQGLGMMSYTMLPCLECCKGGLRSLYVAMPLQAQQWCQHASCLGSLALQKLRYYLTQDHHINPLRRSSAYEALCKCKMTFLLLAS